MEKLIDIVEKLGNSGRFGSRIVYQKILSCQPPRYGNINVESSWIKHYLKAKGLRLYTHQCQAVTILQQGRNLLITTATASGKTLAFNLPVIEKLKNDPRATALYLYPTKALANDQLKTILELEKDSGIDLSASIYDGDTSGSKKSLILSRSRIILSNPYQMHHSLNQHWKWERFFKNLSFIILDEAHQYRGVFGSHIALLIRRINRILDYYGAKPQFVVSTATLANPVEFSTKLTGREFELVEEDGSPHGDKYFFLYNPFTAYQDIMSTHQETVDLLMYLVRQGLQVLCFTSSRKMAELIAKWAKDKLKESGSQLGLRISSYKAGYMPEQRRDIESSIKDGSLLGVVSTNALEVGIDIGNLDAVIISGFPGTIISTWQQAGRAGRRSDPSLVVMVMFNNPLDQYLAGHPDYIFKSSPEHAVIDLANTYINAGQLLCASAELPLKDKDEQHFGFKLKPYLQDYGHSGLLKDTVHGWIYSGKKPPSHIVDLQNLGQPSFNILNEGKVIETMSLSQAYGEAHPGAVMVHQGETYIVINFDMEQFIIEIKAQPIDYYTRPLKTTEINIINSISQQNLGLVEINYGRISVKETYHAYKIIKDDRTLATPKLNLPPVEFDTLGLWFNLPDHLRKKLDHMGLDFGGGIHGTEHSMISIMPLLVMCDRWDIGGVSYTYYPPERQPAIFIYDAYPGGIGLSEKGFYVFGSWSGMAYELVRDCSCSQGCPACVYSPKCGNDNQPLDKQAAVVILEHISSLF